MADYQISIEFEMMEYLAWLRSSYLVLSQISEGGTPMIDQLELGLDQRDIFTSFWTESALEVSKLFTTRQHDVNGVPFEFSSNDAIYRFNEGEPVLTQAAAIKAQMNEDVKQAIYCYIAMMWFKLKQLNFAVDYYSDKYAKLALDIKRNLYYLHD